MSARTDPAVITRYENDTGVPIEIVQGDLRTSRADLIVFGRNPSLVTHFCDHGTRLDWQSVPAFHGWHDAVPAHQWFDLPASRQNILRIPFRPRESSKLKREFMRGRLQLLLPLAMLCSHLAVREVAMCPISCRVPELVAKWMVQELWEFTTICKLGHDTWKPRMIPRKISIYCMDNVAPLLNAFESPETHGAIDQLGLSTIVNQYTWQLLKIMKMDLIHFPYLERSRLIFQAKGFRFRKAVPR